MTPKWCHRGSIEPRIQFRHRYCNDGLLIPQQTIRRRLARRSHRVRDEPYLGITRRYSHSRVVVTIREISGVSVDVLRLQGALTYSWIHPGILSVPGKGLQILVVVYQPAL